MMSRNFYHLENEKNKWQNIVKLGWNYQSKKWLSSNSHTTFILANGRYIHDNGSLPVGIFLESSYSDLYCSIKDDAWRRDVGVIVHPKLRKYEIC